MSQIEITTKGDKFICISSKYKIITEATTADAAFLEIEELIAKYKKDLEAFEMDHPPLKVFEDIDFAKKYKKLTNGVFIILFMLISGLAFGTAFGKAFGYMQKRSTGIVKEFNSLSDEDKLEVFSKKIDIIKPFYKRLIEKINE